MKANMTRTQAAAIAKDLIEGGINARYTAQLTAESHGVSIAVVRKIRRTLLRGIEAVKLLGGGKEEYNRHICSMADSIENGWEDANLNLKP